MTKKKEPREIKFDLGGGYEQREDIVLEIPESSSDGVLRFAKYPFHDTRHIRFNSSNLENSLKKKNIKLPTMEQLALFVDAINENPNFEIGELVKDFYIHYRNVPDENLATLLSSTRILRNEEGIYVYEGSRLDSKWRSSIELAKSKKSERKGVQYNEDESVRFTPIESEPSTILRAILGEEGAEKIIKLRSKSLGLRYRGEADLQLPAFNRAYSTDFAIEKYLLTTISPYGDILLFDKLGDYTGPERYFCVVLVNSLMDAKQEN